MCNFLDFSVTQILREINFGESGSCKRAVFANLEAWHFVDLVHFSLEKVQKCINITIQSLKMSRMADFETLNPPFLIS